MCRFSYNCSCTVQTCFPELCLRKEILTIDNDSRVKSLQEENESLKKGTESLKDEFGRIATDESSCGGNKQHDPEMEKSLEFVGAEYDDLKGLYVAAKKDINAHGEGLNFLSARVDEMAIEIDNLMLEITETKSKEPATDKTKLCVSIFEAMGFNISIKDIERAHRVTAQNATNGPRPIICRLVR